MQHFLNCSIEALKIIAAILEGTVIGKILTYLGMDEQPPPRGGRARRGKTEAQAA